MLKTMYINRRILQSKTSCPRSEVGPISLLLLQQERKPDLPDQHWRKYIFTFQSFTVLEQQGTVGPAERWWVLEANSESTSLPVTAMPLFPSISQQISVGTVTAFILATKLVNYLL